jgi:hypothetical protein
MELTKIESEFLAGMMGEYKNVMISRISIVSCPHDFGGNIINQTVELHDHLSVGRVKAAGRCHICETLYIKL